MKLIRRCSLLAVLAFLLPSGCHRSRTMAEGLPDALRTAAEQVGQRVAAEVPTGPVLFLHAELSAPLAAAMRKGLEKGLGGKLQLDEMGPGQMPANLPLMSGADVLKEAIAKHRDARAVISAIGIVDDSAGRVPADIPPLYILNWQNPGLYKVILRHPRCRGGLFYERSPAGPVFRPPPAAS